MNEEKHEEACYSRGQCDISGQRGAWKECDQCNSKQKRKYKKERQHIHYHFILDSFEISKLLPFDFI